MIMQGMRSDYDNDTHHHGHAAVGGNCQKNLTTTNNNADRQGLPD